MREYMKARRKARRAKYLSLLGAFCYSCGSTDPETLQFDHVDSKKKTYDLNAIKDGKEEIILKELSKCNLLCKDCHLEKTQKHRDNVNKDKKPAQHGTVWYYKKYNCRCRKCKMAMRMYNLGAR